MWAVFLEPDFGLLPPGAEGVFTRRIDALPVDSLRRRLDADAIMHNEMQFLRRFCEHHRVDPPNTTALGTWHLRAVIDRLSALRPDLVPPRPSAAPASMINSQLLRLSGVERVRWRWRRLRPNFLVGWPTWFMNRWSQIRSVWVRRRAKQLRGGDSWN